MPDDEFAARAETVVIRFAIDIGDLRALASVLDACPETVGKLAEFLDTGVDAGTAAHTDFQADNKPRFAVCGWCPEESWPEGSLFGIEVLRLCEAVVDPI